MVILVLSALYFFLPSYVANAVPVLLARYELFEKTKHPVDHGKKWKGNRIFGDNKTYRGLIGGVIAGGVIAFLQMLIYLRWPESHWLYVFPYNSLNVIVLGLLMGLGEGLGDMIKSFIKRSRGIASGKAFFPFDQMSFIGALLLSFLFYVPPIEIIVVILVVSPLIPIAANLIAYKLGWKKVWW